MSVPRGEHRACVYITSPSHGLLLVGSPNDNVPRVVQIKKPLKVLWREAQSGPGKALQPFRNRVKGTSNVSEGEVRRGSSTYLFQMIQHLDDRGMGTVLRPEPVLMWMQ